MKRHPKDMGVGETERFLSDLATHDKIAASIQRLALNTIMFLYQDVLHMGLGNIAPVRSGKAAQAPDRPDTV